MEWLLLPQMRRRSRQDGGYKTPFTRKQSGRAQAICGRLKTDLQLKYPAEWKAESMDYFSYQIVHHENTRTAVNVYCWPNIINWDWFTVTMLDCLKVVFWFSLTPHLIYQNHRLYIKNGRSLWDITHRFLKSHCSVVAEEVNRGWSWGSPNQAGLLTAS